MPFLDLFVLVASGATIFALIVGIFSVYNVRKTRKEISNLINEIRNLMVEESRLTRDLIVEESRLTRELIAKI